ncbi:hypothetical protein SAMD00019534_082920 [Acytostelium subglobosum LB1]|uniref:hypothetical protein n=1 Tax=Acytostelium subglobosum LB1 TaxID=1410327 RepID=UPI0006449113|nr:hypothetical protein SAMD00019534_082920 [Acytostelium subglobosum LB1]GAM25117.1 hypothetical protein SAMD00019534_082920 [Acytostelium subglobosum LB1]|eukprot:XP_012752206.1 hypothetical protein SAMD00019534_082920 [Acytostelium subglobosum LB1]
MTTTSFNRYSLVQRPLRSLTISKFHHPFSDIRYRSSEERLENERLQRITELAAFRSLLSTSLEHLSTELDQINEFLSSDLNKQGSLTSIISTNDDEEFPKELARLAHERIQSLVLHTATIGDRGIEPLYDLLESPSLCNLTCLKLIDTDVMGGLSYDLTQDCEDLFDSLLNNAFQLSYLELSLEFYPNDYTEHDMTTFEVALLRYLKSESSLRTFKFNQSLNDEDKEISRYLFQSAPSSTLTNLSIGFLQCPSFAITRQLDKLEFEDFHRRIEDEDYNDEFIKSIDQHVRHFKTSNCELIIKHNIRTSIITTDFIEMIDTKSESMCTWLKDNDRTQYIYNTLRDQIERTGIKPNISEFNAIIQQHPSIINKSTWNWCTNAVVDEW